MLMRSDINSEFQKYLLQRNERIIDLIDNSLNRFSHKFFLKNLMYEGDVKEVILFYPNVHSPQKIISVFYPLDKQDDELDKNSLKNLKSSDLYVFQEFIRYMIDDIKTAINVISGYNDLCHIENKHQEVMSYNQQIRESCSQILESIFDVMQVYKISSQASHLEESVFSCEEIITECLEKFTAFINDNKIILNFELHNEGLFVISDKNIFGNALSRIIDAIIRSSANSSKINIKIIEDIKNEKINIIIVDETKLNIEKIFGLDINDIFNNQKIRNTVNINLKIAESYLKLLKFDINAQNYNQNGNIINIQISDDMVTSYHERDSNNVVI